MPDLQAARGASLIASDTTGDLPGTSTAAPARRTSGLVFAVAAGLYVVDQVTKQVAVHELTGRRPVEVVGEVLQLRLLLNPGAAFSTGVALTPLITVVAIAATVAVVVFALRSRHRGWSIGLGLLLAGVTGNLTDRMLRPPGPFRGHVVDFLALPHWPVFNVADMCINVAAAFFVVLLWRGVRLDGARAHHGPTDAAEDSP